MASVRRDRVELGRVGLWGAYSSSEAGACTRCYFIASCRQGFRSNHGGADPEPPCRTVCGAELEKQVAIVLEMAEASWPDPKSRAPSVWVGLHFPCLRLGVYPEGRCGRTFSQASSRNSCAQGRNSPSSTVGSCCYLRGKSVSDGKSPRPGCNSDSYQIIR